MQVDTQDRFYNEILDMSTNISSANNTLFSKERIQTLIGGVKQEKDGTKPSGKERTLLKQYEILTAGNLEKLGSSHYSDSYLSDTHNSDSHYSDSHYSNTH